ncbi:hypothetical protein CHARACLAT_033504 [Characodon lateralis]|uniref:Uncharacterized protein n=1 Tax=Characodon lateralis TaxID=208331 RepID=A0ABU7FA63_9TELE|nr:hypothetical protein [Characodon lateralis]
MELHQVLRLVEVLLLSIIKLQAYCGNRPLASLRLCILPLKAEMWRVDMEHTCTVGTVCHNQNGMIQTSVDMPAVLTDNQHKLPLSFGKLFHSDQAESVQNILISSF